MLKEFKEFALKGSLLDIAVGFVMGAAFKTVVTAFTGGIISPLIGMLIPQKKKLKKTDLILNVKPFIKSKIPAIKYKIPDIPIKKALIPPAIPAALNVTSEIIKMIVP